MHDTLTAKDPKQQGFGRVDAGGLEALGPPILDLEPYSPGGIWNCTHRTGSVEAGGLEAGGLEAPALPILDLEIHSPDWGSRGWGSRGLGV